MFYSQFILAKKGPLGTIWIAAHLERKLRKNQVADTDIGVSVDSILFPDMPIALRLSSHLLLGVVRIYSRKVNYLFDDCSEALLKVKQAFRSAAVDLPPEESTAPYNAITLPETFDLDDFELPDSEIFQGSHVDHHVSSKDQITLQDTMEGVVYSTSKFGLDERFGDGDASGLDLDEELLVEKAAPAEHATGPSYSDVDPQTSVQADASLKYEENQDDLNVPAASDGDQMEDYDDDNEPVDYAQAPCTPGLWEEPNLPKIQETSAFDDHQDPENHCITESAVKNIENTSIKEAECFPHEQQYNQFEPHEKPLSDIVATEHTSMDRLDSMPFTEPVLADQDGAMSPKTEVFDDPARIENILHSENGRDEEPGVQIVENQENRLEFQGHQGNTCYLTNELEPNNEPSGKDDLDNPIDQAFPEPKDSLISGPPGYSVPLRPCVTDLNHSEVSGQKQADSFQSYDFTHLRSLETSRAEDRPSASGDSILVQGEGPHAAAAFERNLPEVHLSELGLNEELQVASNISSYTSNFPAPEKLLSLPQGFSDVPKDLAPESTPAEGSDMITGKKRSFTESSLTAQSLNFESSGLFTTHVTRESLQQNDDLLSSILVGRGSSVLKMKPTPPRVAPSTKRRRSAPKTGVSRRKVLMDDNMVLHGDIIRQQLTNTEDIRRLRKKAPCTRSEISMINKQFWEDELFNEVIFTGVSIKLVYLHNHSFDLSKMIITQNEASLGGTDLKSISQNDENGMQLELGTEQGAVVNRPLDDNTTSSDYYVSQAKIHSTSDIVEPFSTEKDHLGQRTPMEIDTGIFQNIDIEASVIPIEVESPVHANGVPSDLCAMSAAPGDDKKASETDAFLQMEAPIVHSDEKTEDLYMNTSIDQSLENNVPSEIKDRETSKTEDEIIMEGAENGTSVIDILDHTQMAKVSATFSSDPDGLKPQIVTLDQETEIGKNEEEFVNEDAHNLVSNGEEVSTVAAYDSNVNPVSEDVPLDDREHIGHQASYPTSSMNIEEIPDNRVNDEELTYTAIGNDTDFLNFDDDDDNDEGEAGGDYMPDVEATHMIDNSGWSSRTKAVAKYLQIMFDKEGERGRNVLPVNSLLAGKTRKEASRMFFETLVLKTKDYIHVEQRDPFENINILPRAKLLKSDF